MTTPPEKPMIFSRAMILALLSGRKWQTRRPVKFRLPGEATRVSGPVAVGTDVDRWSFDHSHPDSIVVEPLACPFGVVGGRLWVRETWRPFTNMAAPGCVIDYAASSRDRSAIRWRPSIYMPRWASRLTLEITAVRVERAQEISETDALAEGFEADKEETWWEGFDARYPYDDGRFPFVQVPNREQPPEWLIQPRSFIHRGLGYRATDNFRVTWDSLYAKRGFGWDANPWVWVLAFRRIKP